MRFVDEAIIRVGGGHGGAGCISFRREKFIPRGGPNGGDGGKGGDIYFVSDAQLSTLQDFRFKHIYQAAAGERGGGSNKAGSDGESIWIRVPVGTVLTDVKTGEILKDFEVDQDTWRACKGGRGGKGNAHFVTSTFQAPMFAQPGEEGESFELKMELKLLADVAIIGCPNAGKSTLISAISAARPKIADYAFTTLTPNLGVVALPEIQSFVVADIPGLIEGAHRGEGLGHRFLKHIERTAFFIHLIDSVPLLEKVTDPTLTPKKAVTAAAKQALKTYQSIRKELGLFDPALLEKPEIVVFNKSDLLIGHDKLTDAVATLFREKLPELRLAEPLHSGEPFWISAATQSGVQSLMLEVRRLLDASRKTDRIGSMLDAPATLLPDQVSYLKKTAEKALHS